MTGNLYDNGYLTIGQFSELADLSEHTLRYYEKVGVFLPVCRSKGSVAGYRLYSPTQLTTIKSIRTWAKAGASLEEIGELMRHRTPEIALLEFQECDNKLEEKANFIADSRQFNDIVKRLLEKSFHVNKAEIVISKRVETAIILGKENDFIGANGYIRELTRFCKTQCGSEVNSPYPIAGYFNSMHDFTNAPSQPNRFLYIDPAGHDRIEAGLYLTGFHQGDYGQVGDLPERMWKYALSNGYSFSGPVYNIYLIDETSTADPSQYLLQVCASVKKNKIVRTRNNFWNKKTTLQ